MSQDPNKTKVPQETEYGTHTSYLLGYSISFVLTLVVYFLATQRLLEGWALDGTIGAIAILQAFVYLFFFLHLKEDSKPRWNLLTLLFTVMVVVILVFGSIWIMNNLMYNLM